MSQAASEANFGVKEIRRKLPVISERDTDAALGIPTRLWSDIAMPSSAPTGEHVIGVDNLRVQVDGKPAGAAARFGAVRACVAYKVKPVKARPPTRLPSTVGISFQIK